MIKIGFVLLTHANSSQILRLVGTLNRMFNSPPIACHHDFSKCWLEESKFPDNVIFVKPSLNTCWGAFSLVEAMLAAMKLLLSHTETLDWIILLSGTDYPIKNAQTIYKDLSAATVDAFVEHIHLHPKYPLDSAQKEYRPRYFRIMLPFTKRQIPLNRIPIPLPFWLMREFTVWRGGFECYVGSQWFCTTRKCAQYLLDFHNSHSSMLQFFRGVPCSDEVYFQSIICNAPDLKTENNNLRYIEMLGAHAKTLTSADLSKLLTSRAHFARKFDMSIDSDVLDAIDEAIL
jgi:hypothetical protein